LNGRREESHLRGAWQDGDTPGVIALAFCAATNTQFPQKISINRNEYTRGQVVRECLSYSTQHMWLHVARSPQIELPVVVGNLCKPC
jgi:hypothetical protein